MVRYFNVKHGDRAKYHCNPGFNITGHLYLTCEYGEWEGTPPVCDEGACE